MLATETAGDNMGMKVTRFADPNQSSMGKGESFTDDLRMHVGRNTRIVAIRTSIEGEPLYIAKRCQEYVTDFSVINPGPVNIINCGDGRQWHPTQTVLDMLTIKRTLGRLDNFTLGIMGDPSKGRTAHTLLQAFCRREGMKFKFAAPKGFELPDRYKLSLANVTEGDSLDILADCDIVYVTRFQLERMSTEEKRYIESVRHRFIINQDVLDSWKPDVRVMHPLPRVDEIDSEVSLDKRIIAFQQAEYGIPARMAIIAMLCETQYVPIDLHPVQQPFFIDQTEKTVVTGKPLKHFQPIKCGTVIDHIPPGQADNIERLLKLLQCLPGGISGQSVRYVKSSRHPSGKKDVLLLNDYELPEFAGATIQTLYPGVTINYLPGNSTILKRRYRAPIGISQNVHCTNNACITNNDREAKPNFLFTGQPGADSKILTCEYCGTPLWD